MWQQQQSAQQYFDNLDKCSMDSETGDSGFLSCSNSALNSCSSEFDPNSMESLSGQPIKNTRNEIDCCLSDNFNQLSLEQVPLNPLGSSTKGCMASTPGSDSGIGFSNKNDQEPWLLYYTQNEDGDTLLHAAIIQDFLEASLSLINMAPHPCLLDISNDYAQTALHLAVMTNQPEIVRKLVSAGADLSIRNHEGNTALHLACIFENLACARALTEQRKSSLPQILEQRNYNGETCLHIAASKDHVELVKLLMRAGANPEAQEYLAGRTPLHLALEYGCSKVVLFFVQQCRLNLDAATYAGYTAHDIASCIDEKLARELVRYGATPPQKIAFQESTKAIPQVFATACGV